jgi:hypothetical protein
LGYFDSISPRPHPWFAEIEEALNIIGCSYSENAAHLDLSPRATRAMRGFTTPPQRQGFIDMLSHDTKWLGRALDLATRAKLVVLVGWVPDQEQRRGIGVGSFLSRQAPELWSRLSGRRWPRSPCSKRQLAERVYRKRQILVDLVRGHDSCTHA